MKEGFYNKKVYHIYNLCFDNMQYAFILFNSIKHRFHMRHVILDLRINSEHYE